MDTSTMVSVAVGSPLVDDKYCHAVKPRFWQRILGRLFRRSTEARPHATFNKSLPLRERQTAGRRFSSAVRRIFKPACLSGNDVTP